MNNVLSTTDGRGLTTTFEYSPGGYLVAKHEPTGIGGNGAVATTRYVLDAVGNIVIEIDPRGAAFATTTVYDAQNRPTRITRAGGGSTPDAVETYNYDAVGNVLTATDPLGRVTTTIYDAQNRPVRVERTVSGGGAGVLGGGGAGRRSSARAAGPLPR